MSNELAIARQPARAVEMALPTAMNDVREMGKVLAASGYFKDIRSEAQAITKILYGRELGIAPVTAMMGMHVIEGKPVLSSNMIATLIKRSGRYNYRVVRWDAAGCELIFVEAGQELGPASFLKEDAQAAGLLNKATWKQYPKAMYFARAISMGARAYCADIFGGAPVYTPEELGATVDAEGELVQAPESRHEAFEADADDAAAEAAEPLLTDAQRGAIWALANTIWGDDAPRKLKEVEPRSTATLTKGQASDLIDRLRVIKVNGVDAEPVAITSEPTSASEPEPVQSTLTPVADDEPHPLDKHAAKTDAQKFKIPAGTPKGRCKGCDAEILYVRTDKGGQIPVNPDGTSHFINCPKGDQFRRPKPGERDKAMLLLDQAARLKNLIPADERADGPHFIAAVNAFLDQTHFNPIVRRADITPTVAQVLAAAIRDGHLSWKAGADQAQAVAA